MTDPECWSSATYVYLCHVNVLCGVECRVRVEGVTAVRFPVAFRPAPDRLTPGCGKERARATDPREATEPDRA